MRLALVAAAALLLVVAVAFLATRPGPAASTELAGVSVSLAGQSVVDLPAGTHRLELVVVVSSGTPKDACLAFALDEPIKGRTVAVAGAGDGCYRPAAGSSRVALSFDALTDDDVLFGSHSLLWGLRGGRCGPILGLLGLCALDVAGTVPLSLPSRAALPSFRPIGSLFPLSSFAP